MMIEEAQRQGEREGATDAKLAVEGIYGISLISRAIYFLDEHGPDALRAYLYGYSNSYNATKRQFEEEYTNATS